MYILDPVNSGVQSYIEFYERNTRGVIKVSNGKDMKDMRGMRDMRGGVGFTSRKRMTGRTEDSNITTL